MRLSIGFLFCLFSFSLANSAEDSVDPKNEIMEFDKLLTEESHLAVLFTVPCCTCTDCVEAEVLLGGMSKELEDNLGIRVVRLKENRLKARYGIKKVPAMVYIRNNKAATYDGEFDFDSVYSWLQEYQEPSTFDLNDSSFEHLTQASTGATTGDWLVLFHNNKCCKARELMHLENAGIKLKNRANVASVNVALSPEIAERFKITKCPEVVFFRHQRMYRFSLPDITENSLRRFAESFYKNSKAEKVPVPPSLFDKLIESIIQYYKDNFQVMMITFAITIGLAIITLYVSTLKTPSKKSTSKELKTD